MDLHRHHHRHREDAANTASHHQPQNHRHQLRLSVPPRTPLPSSSLRHYGQPASPFPFSPYLSPAISTPSKPHRSLSTSTSSSFSSIPSILLLLFSLRSLYSLLPFLRSSSPYFSLFPFSFLVSALSFLLTALCYPLLPPEPLSSRAPISFTLLRPLVAKSLLLAIVFLLRFQALHSCGTAATILADFSGALVARSFSSTYRIYGLRAQRIRDFVALALALVLLSHGWDRIRCFPLSSSRGPDADEGCVKILPMLLPFVSGFLGFFEGASPNWIQLRQLGRRRVRLLSLGLATGILFFPALASFFVSDWEMSVPVGSLGWCLANTVIFGVVLSRNFDDEKVAPNRKDFHREFLSTFFCTLVLELFYSPHFSLPGFLFCGFLLWISVYQLDSSSAARLDLSSYEASESLYSIVVKPVHHILSERKSRKIAMFLLINTAYMVVEFVAGFLSNSLGLISDACHMLFDCAALAIGLYASYISRLPANAQFNYGRGRFEVLSGYVNAVFLVLVGALIVLESFERILDPQEISTNSLLTVSIGGLLVNVVGLVFFHEEHHHAHGGGTCSHSHSELSHPCGPHDHHHHHHAHAGQHICSGTKQQRNIFLGDNSLNKKSCDITSHYCYNHTNHQCSDGERRNGCESEHSTSLCSIYDAKHQDNHHDHSSQVHGCLSENHSVDKTHPPSDNCNSVKPSCNHYQGQNDVDCSNKNSNKGCHIDKGPEGRIHSPKSCQGSREAHSCSNKSNESLSEQKMLEKPQKHRLIDHNMEGIFLHVLADTMGSVGVVVSTLLIKYKGWLVADPASSIFISVMIISSVIPLLRNSAEILLQRIPRVHEQDIRDALDDILAMKGIYGVHNMHIWNFTNADIVGTLHLHVSADSDKFFVRNQVSQRLLEAGIKDLTIQIECT